MGVNGEIQADVAIYDGEAYPINNINGTAMKTPINGGSKNSFKDALH